MRKRQIGFQIINDVIFPRLPPPGVFAKLTGQERPSIRFFSKIEYLRTPRGDLVTSDSQALTLVYFAMTVVNISRRVMVHVNDPV